MRPPRLRFRAAFSWCRGSESRRYDGGRYKMCKLCCLFIGACDCAVCERWGEDTRQGRGPRTVLARRPPAHRLLRFCAPSPVFRSPSTHHTEDVRRDAGGVALGRGQAACVFVCKNDAPHRKGVQVCSTSACLFQLHPFCTLTTQHGTSLHDKSFMKSEPLSIV